LALHCEICASERIRGQRIAFQRRVPIKHNSIGTVTAKHRMDARITLKLKHAQQGPEL